MQVKRGPGVKTPVDRIMSSRPFIDWENMIGRNARGEIEVLDVDEYGGEIHSLVVKITPHGAPWPIRTILRSPTVDALTILTDGRHHHVVLVEQYRPSVGLTVLSNPAGGMGWSEHHYSAARREVREELGLSEATQIDCSLLRRRPMLATPGLTNERVFMVRAVIRVARKDLGAAVKQLQGKKTGVEAEGERIVVRVWPMGEARQRVEQEDFPDAKTLLSFSLAGI